MTNTPKIKRFRLTIEVEIDTLIASYTGDDKTIKDLPSIEEIIEFSMGWTSPDGIQVKDITEINN